MAVVVDTQCMLYVGIRLFFRFLDPPHLYFSRDSGFRLLLSHDWQPSFDRRGISLSGLDVSARFTVFPGCLWIAAGFRIWELGKYFIKELKGIIDGSLDHHKMFDICVYLEAIFNFGRR